MSLRSYSDALDHLNAVQSIEAAKDAWLTAGRPSKQFIITETVENLRRIGYSQENLNSLNVIHVAGTKGKGSTSAFTDSILRHVKSDWKIGLYTSPHLVSVRERIRINGTPISEEDFAKFFFEVWERLDENDKRNDLNTLPKSSYFKFMTLMAFHVFLTLKVDATILEVGAGGAYSATNVVPKPVVTAITALGMDHMDILGATIGDIAWHKAGIFQEGAPALTVEQPEEAMSVLREQAVERKGSGLAVIPVLPQLSGIRLGLAGNHQRQNASLSVQIVHTFFRSQVSVEPDTLPRAYIEGLEKTTWPGRCQTVADPNQAGTTWFLDGAHTVESLDCCMEWFISPNVGLAQDDASKQPTRVLIFSCTSGRSGAFFLGTMMKKAAAQLKLHGRAEDPRELFDHVIFCTIRTHANGIYKKGLWLDSTVVSTPQADRDHFNTPQELAAAWSSLVPDFPTDHIHTLPSIDHAVNLIRGLESHDSGRRISVLVTGSLYVVGGVIKVAGLTDVAL